MPEHVSAQKCVNALSTQQARRIYLGKAQRSAWLQRRTCRPYVFLLRRASQFDPTIDKERKLINNLRWNMLVLPDNLECVALRADMEGDRLNSRFQHTHKNKSVKTHGVMEGKIVYNSG